jgi:hypothetical protein
MPSLSAEVVIHLAQHPLKQVSAAAVDARRAEAGRFPCAGGARFPNGHIQVWALANLGSASIEQLKNNKSRQVQVAGRRLRFSVGTSAVRIC